MQLHNDVLSTLVRLRNEDRKITSEFPEAREGILKELSVVHGTQIKFVSEQEGSILVGPSAPIRSPQLQHMETDRRAQHLRSLRAIRKVGGVVHLSAGCEPSSSLDKHRNNAL